MDAQEMTIFIYIFLGICCAYFLWFLLREFVFYSPRETAEKWQNQWKARGYTVTSTTEGRFNVSKVVGGTATHTVEKFVFMKKLVVIVLFVLVIALIIWFLVL